MNIGIFTDTYYPEINGVASSVYELKQGLEQLGHTVYIFTVSNPLADARRETNVYRFLSVPFPMLKERRIGCVIPKMWVRMVEALNLDVIHTQTEFAMGHLGKRIARQLGIVHIHSYHTIYEDYLSYIHMPDRKPFRKIARRFSRLCCNRADEIIVPTEKVKDLLEQYHVYRRIHVIPSGISLSKFENPDEERVEELKKQLGVSEDKLVLLYVGRLSKEKNITELITYMDKVRDRENVVLLLVGDGPERDSLKQQVRELQLESKIIFAGMASYDEIENYYALGDIFVSSSTSETQGLTYAEALACGLPLLVRRDACLDKVLKEYENGVSYTRESDFLEGLQYLERYIYDSNLKENIVASIDALGSQAFAERCEKLYQDCTNKENIRELCV